MSKSMTSHYCHCHKDYGTCSAVLTERTQGGNNYISSVVYS